MNYLSKAYQYYSGINPATLTGAIDVIVVRHRDENGDEFFSCSPFHVRFGKLQVLRAGEKRVTLTFPDNNATTSSTPSGSGSGSGSGSRSGTGSGGNEAPFWMKVGEAGEAFFVVETDEEVPEELQTSPVIKATEVSPLTPPISNPPASPHSHTNPDASEAEPNSRKPDDPTSATQKPFGHGAEYSKVVPAVETVGGGKSGSGMGGEPEFLDLSEGGEGREKGKGKEKQLGSGFGAGVGQGQGGKSGGSSVSPSSILNTASSYLPSFLSGSSTPSHPDDSYPSTSNSTSTSAPKQKKQFSPPPPPPNPLRHRPDAVDTTTPPIHHHAEKIKDYVTEHKPRKGGVVKGLGSLVGVSRLRKEGEEGDEMLPALKEGEGEAPDVIYKEDVVLDMSGYHQQQSPSATDSASDNDIEHPAHRPHSSALEPDTPAKSEQRLRDNLSLSTSLHASEDEGLMQFAQDLLLSAGAITNEQDGLLSSVGEGKPSDVVKEITRRMNSFDLSHSDEEGDRLEGLPARREGQREGFNRGASEPPEIGSSAAAGVPVTADYTWEWGGFPTKTPAVERGDPMQMERPSLLETHVDAAKSHSLPDVTHVDAAMPSIPPPPARLERLASAPAGRVEERLAESQTLPLESPGGKLKNDEANPYLFILEMHGVTHEFELGLGGEVLEADTGDAELVGVLRDVFEVNRITFKHFVEDPKVVDLPDLVVKYRSKYLTWQTASPILAALAVYRRSLLPPDSDPKSREILPALSAIGVDPSIVEPKVARGYGWSRWWRRGESAGIPLESSVSTPGMRPADLDLSVVAKPKEKPASDEEPTEGKTYYAKTLRLTSDQLKQLNLKDGPNRIVFSVTSSYSGVAQCSARIFLWDEADHVVISDIDGTITKSDALGHVFAAIGRDWTHSGVAKLYTDIANNGYKVMYLTSRAIGQADSTRDYLRSISQGKYQLPEGPVIMSPDRLFTSLHREVIMRKPELFKMACLRDIQRLFGGDRNAFYAGFGNRITDAMSYRSVNVPSSRIFTIDSYGEVKMELLELAGYKSSYIHMTDLVDQMFPPVNRKVIPEYTDFNFWRPALPDIPIPDLAPVPASPALSATSDSSRLSMLGRLTGIARRSSRQTIGTDDGKKGVSASSRPSSPLSMPMDSPDEFGYEDDAISDRGDFMHDSRSSSMPGSYEDKSHNYLGDSAFFDQRGFQAHREQEALKQALAQGQGDGDHLDLGSDGGYDDEGTEEDDEDVYPEMFDDDLLATGEMSKVPY